MINNPPGLFTGLFQLDVPGHKSVNRRNVLGRKSSQNSLTQGNLGSTVFQRPHATLMHLIYKWAIYHLLSGKQKKTLEKTAWDILLNHLSLVHLKKKLPTSSSKTMVYFKHLFPSLPLVAHLFPCQVKGKNLRTACGLIG